MDGTKIEWTDATWNPITGCSVVSPGCTNCYAMRLAGTRLQHHPSRAGLTRDTKAGPVWTGEVRFNEQWLDQPLRWKRPRRIFVCAHGDLFHEAVPDEWIDRVFAVMALAPQHVFQVLTKRPERMRDYMLRLVAANQEHGPDGPLVPERCTWNDLTATGHHHPLPNVWLGTSVEDQARADERIPILLDTPAAVRWISAEPLLSEVRLDRIPQPAELAPSTMNALSGTCWPDFTGIAYNQRYPRLDWVVAGGESGPGARPMHPDWPRSLRDQCAAAGVPFFFKQRGEWSTGSILMTTGQPIFRQFSTFREWVNKAPTRVNGGICLDAAGRRCRIGADFMRARDEGAFPVTILDRVGKKAAGRLLDGVEHNGMPA